MGAVQGCKASRRRPVITALGWCGFIALAPILSGGLCFNGGEIPETETCRSPGPIDIESLELYAEDGESPITHGQVMDITVGGQGTPMFPYRLRANGAAIPECLSQSTTFFDLSFDTLGTYERAVITHPSGADGARATREIWYHIGVERSEPAVILRVQVGDVQAERLLWLPGVDQTPNVAALVATPTSIVAGDSIVLRVTLDRPSPAGGLTVAIGDDSGTFASTSPETAPTTCEGCIAEAHFEEHTWEQEIELQALSANPSGAHLTAASPFLPGSEAPVEVVVIVHP